MLAGMETRTELVARLTREIAEHEELWLRERALAIGKRQQLEQLLSGLPAPTPLAELTLSDAIVEILKRATVPLGPAAIYEQLSDEGRDDQQRSIGGVLHALKQRGRVERVARGSWVAVS